MTQYFAQLVYGPAGAGKTDYTTSAMWDHKKQVMTRNGIWITFGREGNAAYAIPQIRGEDIKAGKGGNLRLTVPELDAIAFADHFSSACKLIYTMNRAAIKAAKPVPFEAVVVDGLTEFDMLFEQAYRAAYPGEVSINKYAVWNALLGRCIAAMQLLDPIELQAYVLVTARVSERRKGIVNKQTEAVSGADPDFITTRNVPAMNGQFRDMFPHYFALVNYVETEVEARMEGGKQTKAPTHTLTMLAQDSDFLIKNQWERQWLARNKPRQLKNTSFDEVLAIIEEITKNV